MPPNLDRDVLRQAKTSNPHDIDFVGRAELFEEVGDMFRDLKQNPPREIQYACCLCLSFVSGSGKTRSSLEIGNHVTGVSTVYIGGNQGLGFLEEELQCCMQSQEVAKRIVLRRMLFGLLTQEGPSLPSSAVLANQGLPDAATLIQWVEEALTEKSIQRLVAIVDEVQLLREAGKAMIRALMVLQVDLRDRVILLPMATGLTARFGSDGTRGRLLYAGERSSSTMLNRQDFRSLALVLAGTLAQNTNNSPWHRVLREKEVDVSLMLTSLFWPRVRDMLVLNYRPLKCDMPNATLADLMVASFWNQPVFWEEREILWPALVVPSDGHVRFIPEPRLTDQIHGALVAEKFSGMKDVERVIGGLPVCNEETRVISYLLDFHNFEVSGFYVLAMFVILASVSRPMDNGLPSVFQHVLCETYETTDIRVEIYPLGNYYPFKDNVKAEFHEKFTLPEPGKVSLIYSGRNTNTPFDYLFLFRQTGGQLVVLGGDAKFSLLGNATLPKADVETVLNGLLAFKNLVGGEVTIYPFILTNMPRPRTWQDDPPYRGLLTTLGNQLLTYLDDKSFQLLPWTPLLFFPRKE
jgi:hypothetical protein